MRITLLHFTKDYAAVVAACMKMFENVSVTERQEDEHAVCDIEGDFEQLEDLTLWKAHLKFTVKENQIQGERDRKARAILAEVSPEMRSALFAPTIAFVYKRIEKITRTTTIIETFVDGNRKEKQEHVVESEPCFCWEDVTREFGKMLMF